MKNILFYGNCQAGAMCQILKNVLNEYNITIIECWTTLLDKNEFTNIITNSDVIITQPINDNYREKDYLGTKYLLNNSKKDTIIIIFPSLYFNFYYFNYNYYKINNEILTEPSHYHYLDLIESCKNNLSTQNFFNNVILNINYKSIDELTEIANFYLNELFKRENEMNDYKNIRNCYLLNVHEFIKNNYKKNLLFYSVNHPSKYVFHYLCNFIVSHLNIDSNYDLNIDPLFFNERGILYKCIQKVVEFDIDNFKPHLFKYNLEDPNEIVYKYSEFYKKIEFLN